MTTLDRLISHALLVFGVLACCQTCVAGRARAATTEVTPELVCTVQEAIRWRSPAWTPQLCEQVATAASASAEPDLMLSVMVLESQMRPGAIRWVKFRGHDTTSCDRHRSKAAGRRSGPGCYSSAQAFRAWTAGTRPLAGDIADGGLCGVRCMVGRDGRCTNGAAKGLAPAELLDPVVNVRVASDIMASKRRWFGDRAVGAYNGDPDNLDGYASNVRAVRRAIWGRESKAHSQRAAELARKIVAAVRREKTS